MANGMWDEVLPGVWLFRGDSCNVYALEAPGGMLLVDAGSGRWIPHLGDLPRPPAALACTHYFRDHSAGAAAAARAGIPVYVPEGEEAVFADPDRHFRQRETHVVYENLWDHFAPIEGVRPAGVLRDYDALTLAGMPVEVVPLPGVTMTQAGLAVTLADGRRAVFCGEAIHSPGRLARIAPLQYNYNDLSGAVQCYSSARGLRALSPAPDVLLPSLGGPITEGVDAALGALQDGLRRLAGPRPGEAAQIDRIESVASEPLERVTDHVWLDRDSFANTWYLISDSGKALALDYGYRGVDAGAWPAHARPGRRRALLHGLEGLRRRFGIGRIDVVLVSHFHDDHVCGVPVLQRLHGTDCWAAETFADLLERPDAHCFPCAWPEPIRVGRRLPLYEPFAWEEYAFRLAPMSGHTRFSALVGFEADGLRFAHTGDQYFFLGDRASAPGGFAGVGRMQNHVYRNGALPDGYAQSGAWLREWRPGVVLTGHQPAMFTDDAFFAHVAAWESDYAGLHAGAMPLGDGDGDNDRDRDNDDYSGAHFGLDGWGGWIWPYRTHHPDVRPVTVRVTVRNPLPRAAALEVRLVGPAGWQGGPAAAAVLACDGRAEASADLTITPGGPCRRQPFAAELTADGRCFGQVAEALATLGHERF